MKTLHCPATAILQNIFRNRN